MSIIGLGNELLSDDGVGIQAVREVQRRLAYAAAGRTPEELPIAFHEIAVGGLPLLDYLVSAERCILLDAFETGTHPPGTIHHMVLTDAGPPARVTTSHQIDVFQVINLAKMMGAEIPRPLILYGIEGADFTTFHEGCTEPVSRALSTLVEMVCHDVKALLSVSAAAADTQHVATLVSPD